ncbi:rhodanese-like domain-containing protein [Chloroflexota bacterium]
MKFRVSYFDKNVTLGIIGLVLLIGLGIIVFQFARNDNNPETNDLTEIPRIEVDELKEKIDAGANLAIIDTRSGAEYEQIHISGAISLPTGEIAGGYDQLKDYREIVTYCT